MKINIKDLFSKLNPKEYENIEIKENLSDNPNFNNIKNKVLNNIDNTKTSKSIKNKKKKSRFRRPYRNIGVAALIICITATTVFAYSNVEFFRGIFGNDVEITEEDIQEVVATTENKNLIFSVESLLSDGKQNYFVISLETKDGKEIGGFSPTMFRLNSDEISGTMIQNIKEVDGLDVSPNKKYYIFQVNTSSNLIGKSIDISFREGTDKEMTVSFNVEDNNQLEELEVEEFLMLDNQGLVTDINYSKLGMSIKGKLTEDTETIPTVKVKLKYKDNSIIELSTRLEDSDRFGFMYQRDQEEFTNTIIFKELINFDLVESIIIEDKEFKID